MTNFIYFGYIKLQFSINQKTNSCKQTPFPKIRNQVLHFQNLFLISN